LRRPATSRPSEPVALVSEALQRKYFPGEDPLGKRIRVAGNNDTNAWARVVGVVADVRDQNLETEPRPLYFMVYSQTPQVVRGSMRQLTFALRTDGVPIALAESLRRAVREIDPALPVSPIRTFEDGVAQTLAQRRFTSVLLTMFAGFGLGLGVLGVYGVLAYTVAERRQEIGLRRALGAPGARVLLLVLSQGLTPVVVGILVGIGATLSARSVLGTQLYGISPTDVQTYALVAVSVLLAAVLACLIPARRALRVSPLVALRDM
jgi:putative ABC transport system permease protein